MTQPRVLVVHNRYQQAGGEDAVVAAEVGLLRDRGHAAEQLIFDNREIPASRTPWLSAQLAVRTVWSRPGAERVRQAMRRFRPDVVHFHNTFPLISPAAYYAARAEGAAVVQTLHNYRLLCPSATFYRQGQVCHDCLGRVAPWPGVRHACYRGSRAQSAVSASLILAHRLLRTWSRAVDRYVVLTPGAREWFVAGGLPAERLMVKPNFVSPDPGVGPHDGAFALFVGRLSPEKGVHTLLAAWRHLDGSIPLTIVGDGPLAPDVERAAQELGGVTWLGSRSAEETVALMGRATVVLVPSAWEEPFGRVVIEAYATGTPVIGTRLGALAELICDGETGWHVPPGNPQALADRVRWVWAHSAQVAAAGARARRMYEAAYTVERNYDLLLDIYAAACAENKLKPRTDVPHGAPGK